jgi:hypothetical protein
VELLLLANVINLFKMKKFQIFLFVLISNIVFCQNNRFIYKYFPIKDSTKKNISKEIWVLDSYKEGSKFYNEDDSKEDSLAGKNQEGIEDFTDKVYKTSRHSHLNSKD